MGRTVVLYEAFLGLGSNLGDRPGNIHMGVERLRAVSTVLTVSSLYETPPVGFADQPPFLNGACRIWTPLDPFELLRTVNDITSGPGYGRPFPNAPRTLDVDILLHGRSVLSAPHLTVPHPRMGERPFVLVPLEEIAPGLVHPVSGETVHEMLRKLPGRASVRRWVR